MKFAFIFVFVLLPAMLFADSPPDWRSNFNIESSNKKFIAQIYPTQVGQQGEPWKWKYQLTVRDNHTKTPIWTQPYHHPGYSGGILSDDGRFFVFIETFYRPLGNLVTVYSKNKMKSYKAFNLSVSPFNLPKSVSHKLWLNPDVPPLFIFKGGLVVGLKLQTYKGQREIIF